jgi:hypothetical protein
MPRKGRIEMKNWPLAIVNWLWKAFRAQDSLLGDEALHLVSFGAFGFACAWFGGAGAAVVMGVWRFYDEYQFWATGAEDPNGLRLGIPGWAKACLDWLCQAGPSIVAAILRRALHAGC